MCFITPCKNLGKHRDRVEVAVALLDPGVLETDCHTSHFMLNRRLQNCSVRMLAASCRADDSESPPLDYATMFIAIHEMLAS